jgi:hypothetical protein
MKQTETSSGGVADPRKTDRSDEETEKEEFKKETAKEESGEQTEK